MSTDAGKPKVRGGFIPNVREVRVRESRYGDELPTEGNTKTRSKRDAKVQRANCPLTTEAGKTQMEEREKNMEEKRD